MHILTNTRLLGLLLVLALTLTACGSSSDSTETEAEADGAFGDSYGCADLKSIEPDQGGANNGLVYATQICETELGLAEEIVVTFCNSEPFTNAIPKIEYKEQDVYVLHQVVRFHPVDEFDPEASDGHNDPAIHDVGYKIIVADTSAHLHFAYSVTVAAFGDDPGGTEAFDIDANNDDPIGQVGYALTETTIIGGLDELAEEIPSGNDPVFVVLPFGTYNCGEVPEELLNALQAFGPNVHFVVSAGNHQTSSLSFPAAFTSHSDVGNSLQDRVTSVGSIGTDGGRSCFSNFNPANGTAWIDVWHVGEEVLGNNGEIDGTWSGTSFAAPQEAARAAAPTPTPAPTPNPNNDPQPTLVDVSPGGSTIPKLSYCKDDNRYAN